MKKITNMESLILILLSIIIAGLSYGSTYLSLDNGIIYKCILFFLSAVIPLLSYYIIKEKKAIWILILIILLAPATIFGNKAITTYQTKAQEKEVAKTEKSAKPIMEQQGEELIKLFSDVNKLKETFTEESINTLVEKFNIDDIEFVEVGKDIEVEGYANKEWSGYATGKIKYQDEEYFIDYSVSGSSDDINITNVSIIPLNLYEKAMSLSEDANEEEQEKAYYEIEESGVFLESESVVESDELEDLVVE